MTDEPTANDRTDAQEREQTRREQAGGSAGGDESGDTGRGLLRGAAGVLLGAVGLSAASGAASAAGRGKPLLVVGDGDGRHSYEIVMESGGSIQRHDHANGSDAVGTTGNGNQRVKGEVWHWSVDSYTYTGKLKSVTVDGSASVHFLAGGFRGQTDLHVNGQSSGRHLYTVASNNADVDLAGWSTEYVDSDDGKTRTERSNTPDRVSGAVRGSNHDSYTFGYNEPVQNVTVEEGHLRFS